MRSRKSIGKSVLPGEIHAGRILVIGLGKLLRLFLHRRKALVDERANAVTRQEMGEQNREKELGAELVRRKLLAERVAELPPSVFSQRVDLLVGASFLRLGLACHEPLFREPRQCRIDRAIARIEEMAERPVLEHLVDLVARGIPENQGAQTEGCDVHW